MLVVNSNYSSRSEILPILFLLPSTTNFYRNTVSAFCAGQIQKVEPSAEVPHLLEEHLGKHQRTKLTFEKALSEHPLLLWFVHYVFFQEIWI